MRLSRASRIRWRSEEHTSELQSLTDSSYAVFCLKKKNQPPRGGQRSARQSPRLRYPHAHEHPHSVELGHHVLARFFFNATATTQIYTSVNTLSLHDALPISHRRRPAAHQPDRHEQWRLSEQFGRSEEHTSELQSLTDISYAVFCLKKKK